MRESLQSIDRRVIFRETFESEQAVRKNGGVPSGVIFSNGQSTYTLGMSARIIYSKFIPNGTYSVRIKCKTGATLPNSVIVDIRGSANGIGYVGINTNALSTSSGIGYINGVASSSTLTINTIYEFVVTGITLKSAGNLFIGANYVPAGWFIGNIELIEIYSGTLTAQEVKNLYENKRHRELMLNKGEQLVNIMALETGTFNSTTEGWAPFSNNIISWENGSLKIEYVDNQSGAYRNLTAPNPLSENLIIGNKYYLNIRARVNIGVIQFQVGGFGLNVNTENLTSAFAWYRISFIATNTTGNNIRIYGLGAGQIVYIDEWYLEKVLVNPTKEILNVSAINGVVRNKYSGERYNEIISQPLNLLSSSWSEGGTILNRTANGFETGTNNDGLIYNSGLINGKTYRCRMSGNSTSVISLRNSSGTINYYYDIPAGNFAVGFDFVLSNNIYVRLSNRGVLSNFNISIKEVIPSVIPTAISLVKQGEVNAMLFNGSTSKIDCGSYDGLLGDKTLIVWINQISPTSYGVGRIVDNGNFRLQANVNNIWFYSNGSSFAFTPTNSIFSGKTYFIAITRTSGGITNIYINGVLSGSANQSSGTPIVGTGNITIGYTAPGGGGARPFKGYIDNLRIIDGILTPEEISQLYTSEKDLYGL